MLEHLFQEDLYTIPPSLVIIVPKPWHNILEDEKALLTKILGSVIINMGSVTIQSQPKVSMEFLKAFNPGKVLIFGSAIDAEIHLYEKTVLNDITIIKADDLSQLDDVKKKNLWVALKQMFAL
jgi:hypothetical protein